MRIHRGTADNQMVESNSLFENMMKMPEISEKVIQYYPQYSLQYFVDGVGSFAKEEMIGANKFEWFVKGRLNRPVTSTGNNNSGAGTNQVTVETYENHLNPNDTVKLPSGVIGHVRGEAQPTLSGYSYVIHTLDPTAVIPAEDLEAGKTIGKVATAFGEGSETGYETNIYPDKYENYMNTYRRSCSITGDAATDVLWIESNGERLWAHAQALDAMSEFMYEREKDAWYSVSTVDPNTGLPTITDPQTGRPLWKGDGILRQIDGANMDSYSGDLTEDMITSFIMHLKFRAGYSSCMYHVYTGSGGFKAFDKAMKDYFVPNGGNTQLSISQENNVTLGFKSYTTLGVTIKLVHNPIFDDPNLHASGGLDAETGLPLESFKMVFLNHGTQNGVGNIERKVKGAGGISRSMQIKSLPGMLDLENPNSTKAVTARDAHSTHFLDTSCIVVRNQLSCGMWVKVQ